MRGIFFALVLVVMTAVASVAAAPWVSVLGPEVDAAGPWQTPLYPAVTFDHWDGLTGHFNVTVPTNDVAGRPLRSNIKTIGFVYDEPLQNPDGSYPAFDPSGLTLVSVSVNLAPGAVYDLAVTVPDYAPLATVYRFAFNVSVK